MFETELTVAVLDPDEKLVGFLHPRYVDIEETNELYGLAMITITHPLVDDYNNDMSKYDEILIPGNKIWRPSNCDGVPCLYVLSGDKKYDFNELSITITAEEVAGELSQYKFYRSNSSSPYNWIVTTAFITSYFNDLFTYGTVTGPSTATDYNGKLTPMAIIREIEKNTSGEFQFRYELDENNNIERYMDFKTQIGKTINTPIELGYNCGEITVNLTEAETRIAAGPEGRPDDAAKEFGKAQRDFEDLMVSKSVQIPLYVTKDDNGNTVNGPLAYPPYKKLGGDMYVECDNTSELVASYQRIKRRRNAYQASYFDDFEDGKYGKYYTDQGTVRTTPYRDWARRDGTAAMETANPLSGVYSLKHTGNGSDSFSNRLFIGTSKTSTPYRVDFKFRLAAQGAETNTPYIYLWIPRYYDTNNFVIVDTYYSSGTGKQILRLREYVNGVETTLQSINWLTGKLGTSTTYNFTVWDDGNYINVAVNDVLKLGGVRYNANNTTQYAFGANLNSAGIWDNINIQYRNDYPRIYSFESSEENKYNLYWECVTNLREHLKPVIEIEANMIDLKKLMGETPTYFNCGDTVSIRLPGHDTLVTARITKTTKNPRTPEDDEVEIGNQKINFMNTFLRKFFKSPGDITL